MSRLTNMISILLLLCLSLVAAAPALGLSTPGYTVKQGNPKRFKFYDMPTPAAGPCDLCTGPDGALWGEDIFANKIFRIDPKTDKVEEYTIPFTLPPNPSDTLPNVGGRVTFACAIRPGADGNIYASNGVRNQMVQVKLPQRTLKVFTPPPYNPAGDLQPFNDFYTGPHGMYFTQTTGNVISYFEYATETFRNYPVRGSPLGMFVASDGFPYFAEFLGNRIGRLHPKTGKVEEFALPPSLAGPAVIRVEEGGYIYFTAFLGDGIGRLNLKTGKVDAFSFPSPAAFPSEDTKDGQGRVWFSTATQNTLNYLVPQTGEFTSIVQPGTLNVAPISLPFQFEIASHYGPGNAIWFTEAVSNRVGRYQLGRLVAKGNATKVL